MRIIVLSLVLVSACISSGYAVKPENKGKKESGPAVLKTENFKHYIDYFNRMENENIVQAIPNSNA